MAIIEDVKFLNLDHILGQPRNRIARIGVELEGAWNKLPPNTHLEHDGSVFKNLELGHQVVPAGYKAGELPLGPMQPAQVGAALKKYYPQVIDDTCGMHIHMSFMSVFQYALLADTAAYQETVVEYLIRWAKEENLPEKHNIWPRLKGLNEFCQKKFWPGDQIQQVTKDHDRRRQGHRYTMIHYCWRNRTVECRILPMFATPEQSVRAIRRVLDVTNAYLVATEKKRVNAKGKVELADGEVYEEYLEVRL